MPRLFVGLEIPDIVRMQLGQVGGPLPGARWIDTDDLHLTLRFAGDLGNRQADELVGFLDDIHGPPFELKLTEFGAFGGREPRVIHASADGGPTLDQLQRATDRAARSAGLALEPRPFRAHVTLARLRGTSADVVADFLGSRARLVVEPFPVERFVLYSSRPRVGGGPYVIEHEFALRW